MVRLLFFGRFSDIADPQQVTLPEGITDMQGLMGWLIDKYPKFGTVASLPGTQVAVNKVVVSGNYRILNNDEIAFMSALSGG